MHNRRALHSDVTPGTPKLSWASDRHVRIDLSQVSGPAPHQLVRAALNAIRATGIHSLQDATPAHATLLLAFDPVTLDAGRAILEVTAALAIQQPLAAVPVRTVEIPVCYEGECAPDIGDVARHHSMTVDEVAERHAAAAYEVCFIGFAPGFGYLSGLPSELATPRLGSPRLRVPAGSVGIAGGQTGVYPLATPGGWRLIGRTPLRMFDAGQSSPSRLVIGDRVRFVRIPPSTFAEMIGGKT